MSKVVAFFGSPDKNGNSAKLIERVLAGAKSVGANVITYNLNEEGIKGCQGCYYCRKHEGCATQDKLQSMYEEIRSADCIVAGFPIYFAGIGGQSKQWLDRMFPMLNGNLLPRYPGKKAVTVYAQGQPDKDMFRSVIDWTDSFFKMFGWELVDSLLSHGSNDPQYTIHQELLDRAYEAGRQLVN